MVVKEPGNTPKVALKDEAARPEKTADGGKNSEGKPAANGEKGNAPPGDKDAENLRKGQTWRRRRARRRPTPTSRAIPPS